MDNELDLKFKINKINFEQKTEILSTNLKVEIQNIPQGSKKKLAKLNLFLEELAYLKAKIKNINESLIPQLEKNFRLKFINPELLIFALSRPSIKNVFLQIKDYFKRKNYPLIDEQSYNLLSSAGDIGNVLALVGDSVLALIVIQYLWDSSLNTVGYLTTTKNQIISNEELSRICDDWNLYEYRLDRLNSPKMKIKKETLQHEKGTLVEAIVGVLYLENGYINCFHCMKPIIQEISTQLSK